MAGVIAADATPTVPVPPKRILVATLGSLGDLHPPLATAIELKRRGHHVTVASTEYYRNKVQAEGLEFHALSPDWDPTDREMIGKCEELKRGPEVLLRELVLPHLKETTADLLSTARDTDLMIASEMVFGAPLVAEKLNLRWVSESLSPCSFFSAHDPSLLVNAPNLYRLRRTGWLVNKSILSIAKIVSHHWWEPVRELRREMGLNPNCNPIFHDKFSPDLVLALFSKVLAQPQPDWPPQTIQPGFIFFDRGPTAAEGYLELQDFLAAGEAPIVFTLGSTAVHFPGSFYETSLDAAKLLGRRAILIGGKTDPPANTPGILTLPYAPYSQVFPHAAVIAHQGGSGTTGQALRAGRPQLIVPYGWDQPDNGARMERIGVGLCLARSSYTAPTAASVLRRLLEDKRFSSRAASAAESMSQEDPLRTACDAIETVLRTTVLGTR